MLEESFGELMSQDTRMVILDYNEVRSPERLQQAIRAHERLAGIVGTFQPGLPDIPFISLEELFSEQGPELVLSLLTPICPAVNVVWRWSAALHGLSAP